MAAAFVVELPAVVGTLDAVTAHSSEGQRHAAVRANIPHGGDISRRSFTDHDRQPEEDAPRLDPEATDVMLEHAPLQRL